MSTVLDLDREINRHLLGGTLDDAARINFTYAVDYYGLSPREIETAMQIIMGRSNKEAARELFVTEQTVKNHMSSLLFKTQTNDRLQLALRLLGIDPSSWD